MNPRSYPISPAAFDTLAASILAGARAILDREPRPPLDQALQTTRRLLLGDDVDNVTASLTTRLCRHYISAAAHIPYADIGTHPDLTPEAVNQILVRAWHTAAYEPVPASTAHRAAFATLTLVAGQLHNMADFGGDPDPASRPPHGPTTLAQCLDKALGQVRDHQFHGASALHGELLARLALGRDHKPYRQGTYPYLTLAEATTLNDRAYNLLRVNLQYLTS